MLMARAVSGGVRAIYPACLNNMYSADEAQDIVNPNDTNSMPTIERTDIEDAEILEPAPSIDGLKLSLANGLKELSFSSADIKSFATKFKLNEDNELLEKLVNDKAMLMDYVAEFEGKTK